jgi:hypothetical protein
MTQFSSLARPNGPCNNMLCMLFCFLLALPLNAQNSQGTILGHVTDASGALVVGATVRITNVATGVTRNAKTSGVGDYVFVNIPPGNYNIAVEAPAFSTSKISGARLEVEATLRQDFKLQVGAVNQEVTVTSNSQMVQTDNATSGEVISGKLIEDLPISGRDFTNLLRIQAGATEVQGSSTLYWAQHGLNNDFSSVSVNGARTESVSFLVDGVSDNDQYFSTANNVPPSGAIEEFKVQNGLYGAEYGQGSAQVNVAIKSGGNQFHGTLYDYLQNDALEPTSPYNVWNHDIYGTSIPAKDSLKQNQFGFTLGGLFLIPKLYDGHNKTFFFYAYEGGRRRQSGIAQVLVPSAQERTGDFSDWRDSNGNLVPIYDPSTETGGNPATRQPFTNNQVTGTSSTIAQNYLKLYPQPTITIANMADCATSAPTGGCYNYVASLSRPYDTDNNTFRLDENLSDKDRLYFTGILGEQHFHNPSAMPFTGEEKYQRNYLMAANWEHTLSPNTINSFRVGYNWMKWRNGSDAPSGVNLGSQLGFGNVPGNPGLWGVPDIQLQGFQELGNTNSGWTQKENNYEVVDNLKWTHGKHSFTVGTDIRRYMLYMVAAFGSTGQVAFNGAFTGTNPNTTNLKNYNLPGSGSAVADFLLGNPINISGPAPGGSDLFDVRATNWNFFAQDDFRVTPRLTLNLGLRYEIPPAYHDIYDSGAQLDLATGTFLWANKSTAAGIQSAGGYPFISGCCADNKLTPTDKKNFAPRIGIAWRPLSTDRFVVRAGYGLFYDLQNQWYSLTTYDNISVYTGAPATYPGESGTTPTANSPLDTLWLPSTIDYSFFGAGASPLQAYIPYPQINWPGNHSPYNQQWTLDTQYALKPNLLLDIGYVGSHSIRQPGYWYYNAATMPAVDDPCDRYRSLQAVQDAGDATCLSDANFVGAISRAHFPFSTHAYSVANLFSANYNALQVRLNQRFSHGLLYQLNYTWSRSFDNVSAINNIPTENLTLQNNNCFACDRGPSGFDQPSRFVASGSYELPIGKGRPISLGPANWIVGGWNFSGIYTVASGLPQTLSAGLGGDGEDGVRADLRRPDQVGDPNAPVFGVLDPTQYPQANFKSNIFHWVNPAAYAVPAGNVYGDTGRNSVRQPYYMRGDITLAKTFPITERQNFKFGMQIFNVFSLWHASVLNGSRVSGNGVGFSGNVQSSTFGSLVGIDPDPNSATGAPLPEDMQAGLRRLWNPRLIQFLAKYTF